MGARSYPIEVRFADLDLMGHVNNVAYLTYLQESRLKLLYDLFGGTLGTVNVVVARNEIDYVRSLTLSPDPITIETWVEEIGRSSFTIGATIVDPGGDVVARGRTVLVNLVDGGAASAPLSDDMRTRLESARRDAPS